MKLNERLFQTDLILLTGLFLGVVKTAISLSIFLVIPEWFDNLLNLGMCACYGIHVLLQKPGIKRLAAYGAAAVVGAYSALRSGDMMGMITLLTCIALAGCDFERVMKKLFTWTLACFLINATCSVILALINGADGPLTHAYYYNPLGLPSEGFVVHLGYGHKNIFALLLFSLLLMWVWINFHKIRIPHVIALFVISTIVILGNQCKTTYLVIVVLCVMLALCRPENRRICQLTRMAAILCPFVLFAFSFVCVYLFRQGSEFAILVNKVFTGRIQLCATAWDQFGLTFFGHLADTYAQLENRILYMDNVYLYGLVQIGALWPMALCIAFTLLAKRSRDTRVHICILLWSLYSMTEIFPMQGLVFMPALLPALLLSPKKDTGPADLKTI